MNELLVMLEHYVPEMRQTRTWRNSAFRWVQNYNELGRLQHRRPEIYEAAVVALVKHIANRALLELGKEPLYEEGQMASKPFRAPKSRE